MRKVNKQNVKSIRAARVQRAVPISAGRENAAFEPVQTGYRSAETQAETPEVRKRRYVPMDAPFFTLVVLLLAFGLVMLYSASYAVSLDEFGDSMHYIKRQLVLAGAGFAAMIAMTFIDYHKIKPFAVPFLVLTSILLVLTPFIGREVNDAIRWIYIGNFGFQPSELTKLSLVLFLALYIEKTGDRMKNPLRSYGVFFLIVVPLFFTLKMQPHISAFLLMAVTCAVMIYVGGASKKWGALIVGGLAGVGGIGIGLLGSLNLMDVAGEMAYIVRRIEAWRDPFSDPSASGYQTIQSLYAIGSGGLFGVGLGNSRQKQLFLPEMHNDYVFSIVCEELGFIGAMIVLILFAALILRGFWIAMHARDKFGCMLATGITTIYALQVIINIAVTTNTVPVTGMSLPFFSYGGTALGLLLFEMGIILSVSRQVPAPKQG